MIKRFKTLLFVASLAPLHSLSAAVTFNFYYDDDGVSDEAKADIEAAAQVVGGYFNETATVGILVDSGVTNGGTLAGGTSLYANSRNTFNRGAVGQVIVGDQESGFTGLVYEGSMSINFTDSISWGFGSTVASDEYDFQATMIHELFHVVGFSSAIEEDGVSFAGNNNRWNAFDEFIGDSSGALIDPTTFDIDLDRWEAASTGGAGAGGLEWVGDNALAANGGEAIYLYSPTNWNDGSSGSHLDDQEYVGIDYIMESSANRGLANRELSAIEIGMLQDLGYDIVTVVPEPASTSLLALSALGFCFRRHR